MSKYEALKNIAGDLGPAVGQMSGNNLSPMQKSTREGIRSGLAQIPIWGPIIAAASSVVDGIGEMSGLDVSQVDQNIMNRAGAKAAGIAGTVMNSLPGNSMLWGMFLPRAKEFTKNAFVDKALPAYAGLSADISAAQELSKSRTFAPNKINSYISDINKKQNKLGEATRYNTARVNNRASSFMTAKLPSLYSGSSASVRLTRHGGTIPELEEVRSIMQSLQSKKQEIQEPQKFQLGGKMNMIVTGALHARKHNLEELNPNLEGEITKKGIPVVVMNEGGEVQSQQAEVESQELVLQIDTTKTIEDYYDEYNSTDSKTEKNKIALECGKYLVDELLKNTDDPDKLIKKTV